MDINRKIEVVDLAVKVIAEHDDASADEIADAFGQIRNIIDFYEREASARRERKSAPR